MEDRIRLGWLFDFYGPLLTERQQAILVLWCEEDLSLSEIAEREGISRQGVSDCIHKAQQRLNWYEENLGLLAQYTRIIDGLHAGIDMLSDPVSDRERAVRDKLTELLAEEEE